MSQAAEANPPVKTPTAADIARARALTVGSSLAIFRSVVEMCRTLISNAANDERAPQHLYERYGKDLRPLERQEVEKAVEGMQAAMKEAVQAEIDTMSQTSPNTADDEIYPFAAELSATAVRLMFERQMEAAVAEHIGRFSEDPAKLQYGIVLSRSLDAENRVTLLGRALVPIVVSSFEEFLGSMVRLGLAAYPDALGEFKPPPWPVIERYYKNAETNDLHRYAADDKVLSLMRGTPEDWRKRLESWTGIDLERLGADWSAIIECIQRRHLIIHRGSRVDDEYLKNVRAQHRTQNIGTFLKTDQAYISGRLDEFEFLSIRFALEWASKIARADPGDLSVDFGSYLVDLETDREWSKGVELTAAVIRLAPKDANFEEVMRINNWFCRQQSGEDVADEIASWVARDDRSAVYLACLARNEPRIISSTKTHLSGTGPGVALRRRELLGAPIVRRAMSEFPNFRRLLVQGRRRT